MTKIDDLVAVVVVGAPAVHRALSVFPLTCQTKREAMAYLVLDDALATGRFHITELSESGVVPRLLAINETTSCVLLLDGEELIGAKQNRVLNLSLMLAPRSKTEIPVSCVEAGRWRDEGRTFASVDRVQFARGRAEKLERVSNSLRLSGEPASDQCAVWGAISLKAARMGISSPTDAMAAMFEKRRDDLQDYLSAIPLVDNQVGAVYAIGGSIAGLEVFDSDRTFHKLAAKLLASYALDAVEQSRPSRPPEADEVLAFIEAVRVAPRQRSMTAGIGATVRLSTDELVGAALEVDGGEVHLAAFRRGTPEHGSSPRPPRSPRDAPAPIRSRTEQPRCRWS